MTNSIVRIGFLPLVDAALPILARECGFAEEEGITIEMVRDMSWASVRDRLLYGHSDAAHMIGPLSIATSLGYEREPVSLSVPFILGLNGNAITVSATLGSQLVSGDGLGDAVAVGQKLKSLAVERKAAGKPFTFGVVHRYSSHNYMLRYWLAASDIHPDEDVQVVTVAPPYAADALSNGEIDGMCVGEPWNSVAVEKGIGQIILVTAQIWRRGVEKVLAMKSDWLTDNEDKTSALIRALRLAGQHFVDPANWSKNATLLARPEYLDGSAKLIERAISDQMLLRHGLEKTHVPDFMFQYRQAANFPWKSQALWLYSQMLRWDGREWSAEEAQIAESVFRPNIYRRALAGLDEPMPSASNKVEGGITGTISAGSSQSPLTLEPDNFFDGRSFDPDNIPAYLQQLQETQ